MWIMLLSALVRQLGRQAWNGKLGGAEDRARHRRFVSGIDGDE
ncbi:hypothetical protein MMEU_1700 [Mycobacterium marinum str. Europe]|nr:hypothetical protein MMEU_1700 [Mycobacterium marinum str. Europe]